MPTLNLQVGASADDAHAGSITNDSGRSVTSGGQILTSGGVGGGNDLTNTILSPGSHGGNAEVSAGARFTSVTIPNAATITSATFTLTAQATYASGGTIALLVSAQADDNAATFQANGSAGGGGSLRSSGASAPNLSRPRTTAVSSTWTVSSVTVDTEYSIDVTSVVQEIVNRAGWVNGNALVILVDTDTTCTLGEWQDFYSYDGSTTKAPKLSITYSTGGGSLVSPPYAFPLLGGVKLRGFNLVPQPSDTGNKANYTQAGVLDLTPAYFYDAIYDLGKNGDTGRAWVRWLRPQLDAAKAAGANVIRLIYDATVRAGAVGNNGPAVWRGSLSQSEFANQFALIANHCAKLGMWFYPCAHEPWSTDNLTTTQILDYTAEFVALATSTSFNNICGIDVLQEHDRSTWGTTGTNLTDLMTTAKAARVRNLPLTCSISGYSAWTTGLARANTAGVDYFDLHLYLYSAPVLMEDIAISAYGLPFVIGETGCNVNGGYFENSVRQETTKPYSSDRRARHYQDMPAAMGNRHDVQLLCIFGVTREWNSDNQDWGVYSDRQDGMFRFVEQRSEMVTGFQAIPTTAQPSTATFTTPLTGSDTTYAAWANQSSYMLGWGWVDYSNRFTRSSNRVARAHGTYTTGAVAYFHPPSYDQYIQVDFDASQAVASGGEIDWTVALRHQITNVGALNYQNYYMANWVSGTASSGELSIWTIVGATVTKIANTTVTVNLAHSYRLKFTATGTASTSLEAVLTNLTTATVLATLSTTDNNASLQGRGVPGLPANVGTVYYTGLITKCNREEGATTTAPTVTRTSGTALSVSWSAASGGTAPVTYIVETTAVDSYGFPSATSWTANASTSSTSDTVTGLTAFARYAVRVKVTDNSGEVRYSPWTYTEPITLPAVAGTANGSRVRG